MLRDSGPREFQAFSSAKRGLPQHIEHPPRLTGVARCNAKGKRARDTGIIQNPIFSTSK